MLRIENLCCLVGFDERQTATFVKGKLLEYARELYSEEHKRKFTTEKTGFQVVKEPTNGTRLVLAINRKAYCRVVQRANSISYGRAYTDLYNRKGKAEGWNCRIPILNSEQINLLQHKWLSQLFITFVFGLGKLRPRHIRKERSVMLILLLKT